MCGGWNTAFDPAEKSHIWLSSKGALSFGAGSSRIIFAGPVAASGNENLTNTRFSVRISLLPLIVAGRGINTRYSSFAVRGGVPPARCPCRLAAAPAAYTPRAGVER